LHVDFGGSKYVGLDVIFDKIAVTTSINIEDYVRKASIRVNVTDIKGVDSPGIFIPTNNDAKQQFSPEDILTSYLSRPYFATIVVQWYIRGVDPTLLPALSIITLRQQEATEDVKRMDWRLLGYLRNIKIDNLLPCLLNANLCSFRFMLIAS
jgi:hypothetical protein